ncbi:MAG: thioredoxin family protein [Paraclostridium sp.]
MKKKYFIIIILIIVSIIYLLKFNTVPYIDNKTDKNTNRYLDYNISKDTLNLEINKQDTLVYFYQQNCIYCKEIEPIILELIEKNNIDITFFNLEDKEVEWDEYKIEYTPTMVFYKDGKEYTRFDEIDEIFKRGNTIEIMENYAKKDIQNFFDTIKNSRR